MHHQAGAFSETLYVYGEAIRVALQNGARSFLCVGFGLGYLEFLLACHALRTDLPLLVHSFESDLRLRAHFQDWLREGHTEPRFKRAYEKILELNCSNSNLPASIVVSYLRDAFTTGQWALNGQLEMAALNGQRFDTILFDAFSAGTSPELWSREFLEQLIDRAAAPRCLFATYASTGDLKRTLAQFGFERIERTGFAGKRESTLAQRL